MLPTAETLRVLASGSLLHWTIVLFGAIFLFGLAAAAVRRMAMGASSKRPEGLTIQQLDDLRRQGTISQQEYERMRRSVLGLPDPDRPRHGAAGAGWPESAGDEDRAHEDA